MTTKKMIKMLMGVRFSRNEAREIARIARDEQITNKEMVCVVWHTVMDAMMEETRQRVNELSRDIGLGLESADAFVCVGETDTGYNGDLPIWEYV